MALAAALLAVPAGYVLLATDGSERGSTAAGSAAPGTIAHDGLCAALDAADTGDIDRSRALFFDRSHDGLHELAARTAEVDRAIAANLLEAKQRVEAAYEGGVPGATLPDDLTRLISSTEKAMERDDEADVKPCG